MLALKFSRSGRIAATALEREGTCSIGVKFFAGFIQQTGVRRFINECDGEPAKELAKQEQDGSRISSDFFYISMKDAAAKAPGRGREHWTGIASGRSPSEWCHRVSSEDAKSADETHEVWTGEQAGRQLAHDDPILMWIPTFAGDTIARFRKGPDGKTPWG